MAANVSAVLIGQATSQAAMRYKKSGATHPRNLLRRLSVATNPGDVHDSGDDWTRDMLQLLRDTHNERSDGPIPEPPDRSKCGHTMRPTKAEMRPDAVAKKAQRQHPGAAAAPGVVAAPSWESREDDWLWLRTRTNEGDATSGNNR